MSPKPWTYLEPDLDPVLAVTDAATGTYALWVELPDGTRTTEGTLTAEPAP